MTDKNNPTGTNPVGVDDKVAANDAMAALSATDTTTVPATDKQTLPAQEKEEGQGTEQTLSRQEKLRQAKIAMEGFERTVKREVAEKEEQASEEKQKINRLLSKVNHDKELLELTWVNLDDKRSALKKLLEPLLTREEKLEGNESQLESQEDVTFNPRDRRDLEQKRWDLQTERRKLEEEKWIIEERVLKIEEQIEENKKKYQVLLTEEDKLTKQLKDIDEQILLQEEVLRQQRELQEETLRKETLKKIEEEKRRQEAEAARIAETQKIEGDKKAQEEKKWREEELRTKAMKEQEEQQKKFEALRKEEEERQRRETAKQEEADKKAEELKQKIEEATTAAKKTAGQQEAPASEPGAITKTVPTAAQSIAERIAEEKKKQLSLRELQEIEEVRQGNEEAIRIEREKQMIAGTTRTETLIDKLKEEEGLLKPLRTFKDDLAEAIKKQQANGNPN